MEDRKLEFLLLCGPLEDAITMLDEGHVPEARALLERMLELACKKADEYQEHLC